MSAFYPAFRGLAQSGFNEVARGGPAAFIAPRDLTEPSRSSVEADQGRVGRPLFARCAHAREARHPNQGADTTQAVNVKLLPVPQSASFSGNSLLARSMKF